MREKNFLNQVERDLLEELYSFYKLAGWKKIIELNPKQHKTWEALVRKVEKNPKFDYAADIKINSDGEWYFIDQLIMSTAKRRAYTKRNNQKFYFEQT